MQRYDELTMKCFLWLFIEKVAIQKIISINAKKNLICKYDAAF